MKVKARIKKQYLENTELMGIHSKIMDMEYIFISLDGVHFRGEVNVGCKKYSKIKTHYSYNIGWLDIIEVITP